MALLFIISVVVLALSAVCSGAEASLFSISEIRVRARAEEGSKSAIALRSIQQNMSRPIAAIVILNNIANISGSMVIGKVAADRLGVYEGVFMGVFTFAVIICAEIIPKTLGERYSDPLAFWISRPVLFMTMCFSPLLWVVNLFTKSFTRESDSSGSLSHENEIRMMANMGSRQGIINHNESVLISKVLDLDNTTAGDIMTPRVMMTTIDCRLTLGEAKDEVMSSPHSRIVLIDESPDNVVGVLYKHELLIAMVNERFDDRLSDYSHKPRFVPEQASADNLLRYFQASRKHLAVVTDQYSGVAGVVTLEDVLEVLTGEIVDETDLDIDLQKAARDKRDEPS